MTRLLLSMCLTICLVCSFVFSAHAQISDADLDKRAREVGQSLRCVVCQNQSINESDAPLAEDMRKLVRKQLLEGKSKSEIIAYMQDNYGDYVLLKPPVQSNTFILWFGPFLLLAFLFFWFIRQAHADDGDDDEMDVS